MAVEQRLVGKGVHSIADMLGIADRLLAKYPDFGMLYQIKGEILSQIGDNQKA